MERESPSAQPAAPLVQPPTAAAPRPPALAAHGNAAVARAIVARDPAPGTAPGTAPAQAGTPPTPEAPRLSLPGSQGLNVPKAPGELAQTKVGKTIKAINQGFGVPVQIGPLFGEVGGSVVGQAGYNGDFEMRWDRPPAAVTDPLAVKDTLSITKGHLEGKGSVSGGLYAKIGLGTKLANATVGAEGTVKADAAGALDVTGSLTREGAQTRWSGELAWNLHAGGTLTANAAAYFEWNLLWFGGRKDLFRLRSYPLATINVNLGGKITPDGGIVTSKRTFDLTALKAPPAQRVGGSGGGGGQKQVARMSLAAGVPPEEPRPGASVLARLPDEQDGGAEPAEDAVPEEAAGGSGGGERVSPLIPSEDPEGVEP